MTSSEIKIDVLHEKAKNGISVLSMKCNEEIKRKREKAEVCADRALGAFVSALTTNTTCDDSGACTFRKVIGDENFTFSCDNELIRETFRFHGLGIDRLGVSRSPEHNTASFWAEFRLNKVLLPGWKPN